MSAVYEVVTAQTCGQDLKLACRLLRVCAKYRPFIQNKMDGFFMSGAIKNGGEKFSPR